MLKHLHLTHPGLGFWVTVEIHERDGRYMATADLAEDSRDVGIGDTPQESVREDWKDAAWAKDRGPEPVLTSRTARLTPTPPWLGHRSPRS